MRYKLALITFALAAALLIAGSPGGSILASTPTPSPTLPPLQPTPTSIYLFLRPTPTPLTVPIAPTLDLRLDPRLQADLTINLYRWANRDHLFDFVGTAILALSAIALIIRMIARNSRTNN